MYGSVDRDIDNEMQNMMMKYCHYVEKYVKINDVDVYWNHKWVRKKKGKVCVCVCVSERERINKDSGKKKSKWRGIEWVKKDTERKEN